MAVLQAYVDDSGSDANSEAYALSGYLLPASLWDEFSGKWDTECRTKRRIQYYKANEARGLKKEFANWSESERDTKEVRLAGVILDARVIEVGATVKRQDYKDLFSRPDIIGLARKEPYYALAIYICSRSESLAENFTRSTGVPVEQIDFFFDEQGEVGSNFREFFYATVKPLHDLLGECFHVSDRKFLPLQAADMSAWRNRQGASTIAWWTAANPVLSQIPTTVEHLDKTKLGDFLSGARKRAAAQGYPGWPGVRPY